LGFDEDIPSPYLNPDFSRARTVVAVIDTGTRVDHPFLAGSLERNSAEVNGSSGVDDDGNGFVDDTYGANAITRSGSANETYSSHGTHVAGSVKVVRDHAIADFPEAQQVSILPVRFIGDDGSGSTAAAITAMEYAAARGAKVINASWGAKGQAAYSRALYETFVNLYEQNDIFFAVAAGNADGMGPNNNDSIPHFPANYNVPSIMTVASVTPNYGVSGGVFRLFSVVLSDFSNYGRNSVHIAAAGDYSDGRGGGRGVLSAYSGYGPWGNLYVKKQGTSMATPIVAGVAAVMRAVNPSLTAFEVKDLMLRSATQHAALSEIKGSSMVHARNAIELAQSTASSGTRPRDGKSHRHRSH
jgi:subtilisin family serine protease